MGVALLGANVEPALIYNRSPSVPVGYYLRIDDAPARGAFVTIPALSVAPDYARERGYGDATDRFIKRVAAVAGDQVCAHGDSVSVREKSRSVANHPIAKVDPSQPGLDAGFLATANSFCWATRMTALTPATGGRCTSARSMACGEGSDRADHMI
ncbi:MAG: S26 family signal peptidase [Hyphomonadaceae bacterium JAD_PAG50586_4]|nr:MAG: S26 family signal peptidase [Hyphomonadaceae bacterium JAD_PAG50586_4]